MYIFNWNSLCRWICGEKKSYMAGARERVSNEWFIAILRFSSKSQCRIPNGDLLIFSATFVNSLAFNLCISAIWNVEEIRPQTMPATMMSIEREIEKKPTHRRYEKKERKNNTNSILQYILGFRMQWHVSMVQYYKSANQNSMWNISSPLSFGSFFSFLPPTLG